jgi:hypothetical protein
MWIQATSLSQKSNSDLMAVADLLREIEQAKAKLYPHMAPRYSRDEMQQYVNDRAALIRVQRLLIDQAEAQGLQ